MSSYNAELRFELIVSPGNRWHAVASWTWDAQDETCGICRMAFDGCCPDCKLPGDDCPLSKVLCFHVFTLYLLRMTYTLSLVLAETLLSCFICLLW